jgi:hypothetical protein
MEKTCTGVQIMKYKKNRREQLIRRGREKFYGVATDS